MKQEKVLKFDVQGREGIETDRQIVRDFLASNEKLLNTVVHSEDLLRAEMNTEKVFMTVREATISGYSRSQTRCVPCC